MGILGEPNLSSATSIGSDRYMVNQVNMIFAGVMSCFKATIPETFAPVILKRRAAKLRKETGDKNICTEQELFKVPFAQMMQDTLVRPFRMSFSVMLSPLALTMVSEMLFTEPILLLLSMYIALIYGLLVSILTLRLMIDTHLVFPSSTHSSSVTLLYLVAITNGTEASSVLPSFPSGSDSVSHSRLCRYSRRTT